MIDALQCCLLANASGGYDVGGVLAFLIMAFGFYMIPTIVAAARHKSNVMAIGTLNFLLGWSFLGWVVALVWALTKEESSGTGAG